MSLQLISTVNGHIKFHFTGHGTWVLWWSQSSGINPMYMWHLWCNQRITVAQPLLYYDHMVQVEQWPSRCCVMAIWCRWNSGPATAVLWPYGAGGTVAQPLLYYGHMVQVEQNITVQQGNTCINITEACLNTQCNYMYCTFNLTNFMF